MTKRATKASTYDQGHPGFKIWPLSTEGFFYAIATLSDSYENHRLKA